MLRRAEALAQALALCGVACVVLAQDEPPSIGLELSLRADNDALQDQDDHYTSGAGFHAVATADPEPDGLREGLGTVLGLRWPGNRQLLALGVQQALFTPQDLDRRLPAADDTPYAGLLYASLSVTGLDSQRLQAWSLYAGVIGPAAGGEWVQSRGHEITDAADPQGWDQQIGNELLLALAHERRWRALRWGEPGAWGGDLLSGISLSVGNLLTAGRVAVGLRVGRSLPDDFRMPSMFLGDSSIGQTAATPATARRTSYLFGMLDLHLLGYVAAWDGRITTSGGPSVEYSPWMLSGHLGIHVAGGPWDLTLSGILSTVPHDDPHGRVLEGYARANVGFRF